MLDVRPTNHVRCVAHQPKVMDVDRATAIRELREQRQQTQAQFANKLGVRRETVSAWENGQAISLRHARTLIELGLDIAYVLPTAPAATEARAESSSRGAA
jgi:DNA-binding transcriptional regulator YiaG